MYISTKILYIYTIEVLYIYIYMSNNILHIYIIKTLNVYKI